MTLILPQLLVPGKTDPYAGMDLYEILTDLGLTSNLWTVLDAGDSTSYPGSGSTWTDLSGAGHHATITGASFNGVAGGHSADEYFSFDGNGDKMVWAANTFIDNLGKNNAGPITALYVIQWSGGASGSEALLYTIAGTEGVALRRVPSNQLNWRVGDAGGVVFSRTATQTITANSWVGISGFTYTESSGDGLFYTQGVDDVISGAYSGPPTTGPDSDLHLGEAADGLDDLHSGTKLAGVMIWQSALTAANMDAIQNALALRYGWALV